MKRILFSLFALVVMTLAHAEDLDSLYAKSLVKAGTIAPEFTISTTSGESHSLSEFRGKRVVLDFWATWCGDCRHDLPKMKELQEKYASDNLVFVGISFDVDASRLDNFVKENNIGWLQLTELKRMKDSQMTTLYGVQWIPSIVVVNEEGIVELSTVDITKLETLLSK